jgi:TonB family protein
MMMRHAMSRRAATTGGFTTSVAVHAGLFLLLVFMLRMGPSVVEDVVDELTEIAYIEETYGVEVAQQVRLKTRPTPKPVLEETTTPEVEQPVAEKAPEPEAPEPVLKSRPMLETRPRIATRSVLQSKPALDVSAPTLSAEQREQFRQTTSRRLDSRTFADATPSIDTSNLRNPSARAADVNAPSLQSRETQRAFDSGDVALVGRKSSVDLGEVDFEVGSGSSGGGRMALQIATGGSEDGHAGLVGGRLEEGQEAYQGSVAALVETAQQNERRAAAVDVDVDAPALAGNAKGRRTLMDYGGGATSTGRGSLRGRTPAIAEAPSATDIAAAEPAREEPAAIAEAAPTQAAKGVSVTISGQIEGRTVVRSTPPVYSTEARQRGWEGVVAVRFTVLPDGRVKDNVYFEQTSAHRDLNQAAMAAIKQFVFEAMPAGQRIEQWGVITIVFRLS